MERSLCIYNRLFLVFFITIIFSSGCVSDYDGKFPDSEPFPVLNGVLYADSALKFNLTMSNLPLENEFSPIPDADFHFWKNGQPIFPHNRYSDNGTYIFDDTCRGENIYKIEIAIPGYPVLKSETVVPRKPYVNIKKTDNSEKQRSSEVFNLDISKIGNEVHAIYVFLFVSINDGTSAATWEQRGIYCDSPFADPFNRFFDSWAPEGFSYEYECFVRFSVENLPNRNLKTRIALIGGSGNTRIYVIAATKEYDLYYKGGYLQRSYNPEVNLPFTYQPVFLPTNITGGAGIFAGIDLSSFEFNVEN